jgi:phosphohistidine phosphatase
MSPSTPDLQRRLVLLRHAKSAWPHGVPDHERPLAGKGRRNSKAAGQWFAAEGPRPGLVLCSDAVRALQTWEIVSAGLRPPPPLRIEGRLYGADPEQLVDLARQTADDVLTLVLVGHEPTMSASTLMLAGHGSAPSAVAAVSRKFPTGGIAVLRFGGSWLQLVGSGTVLEAFAVPRAG